MFRKIIDTTPRPAWALQLRSPYRDSGPAYSWLGGQPLAPSNFIWPRGTDGKPLHFIAQINLQALTMPAGAPQRPAALPHEGVLISFLGADFIFTPAQMQGAVMAAAPDDLPSLDDVGYFCAGSTFQYWPVDPVGYMSEPIDVIDEFNPLPTVFPRTSGQPEDWIQSMAIAALDAEAAFNAVTRDLAEAVNFFKMGKWPQPTPIPTSTQQYLDQKSAYYRLMLPQFIHALPKLHSWYHATQMADPSAPVDKAALREQLGLRRALSAQIIEDVTNIKTALSGSMKAVMDTIRHHTPALNTYADYAALPRGYHSFMEQRIIGWRGHRIMGHEPDFPNNPENTQGWSPLISIAADHIIGTESEHDYGFSTWYKEKDLARGRIGRGTFIRHCAV